MSSTFYDLPQISVTATNPSVGTNGASIPLSSTQVAGENPSGNLEPLQTDVAGNLLVNINANSDSPIPVQDSSTGSTGASVPTKAIQVGGTDGTNLRALSTDNTGKANINNISGTVSLPTLAATSTKQSDGSQKTQIVDGSGNVIGSTSNALNVDVTQPLPAGTNVIGHVINDAGSAIIGKVGIDQTTPGTTNGVQVNAALPAGSNLIGKVGIDQTTPGTTNGVQVNAALPAGSNLIGKTGIDQTTPGTTNAVALAQIGSTTVSSGNGVAGAGVQRVTIASDNTAFSVNATLQAGSALAGKFGVDQTTPGTTNAVALAQIGSTTITGGVGVATAGTQRVIEASSGTATVSNVASSSSNVTLLASNSNRLNAMFFNDSTQILYLKLGITATTSSYTVQIAPGGYYELPNGKIYNAQIDGIWASANGNCRVTELT